MAERAIRTFQDYQTEGTFVRDVNVEMLLLEPDRTPLYVLTNNSKRKKNVYNPIFEWPEDADMPMIGLVSNGSTAYASNATQVYVSDATLFGVNDIVQVPKYQNAADLGTTAVNAGTSEGGEAGLSGGLEELVLVTAVALGTGGSTTTYQIGAVGGTLTVTRGFASTTAGTIGATATLRIIGNCQTEAGSIDQPRSPYVNMKTSAAQIFEWPIQLTRTAASTKQYYDRSERARLQMLGMRRQKLEIETVGLFGVYSQSVSGTASRYTSMGIRSIISPWVTDVSGTTLTYSAFLASCRFAFRYGSPEKLLMAAPIVKEALDYWAANKQLIKPDEKIFGVSLKRFVTSNGTWLLANNFNMGDVNTNYSQEALGLDLPSIDFCPLSENGINNDTQLITNYDPTNPKVIKDLVYTQAGWRCKHPARHYRLQGVTVYS